MKPSRLLPKAMIALAVPLMVVACGEGLVMVDVPEEPVVEVSNPGVPPGLSVVRTAPRARGASTTSVVGASGGRLSIAGATLTVPPGALSGEVEITMTVPAGPAVAVQLKPHGLQFQQPATLSWSLRGVPSPSADLVGAYFTQPIAADGTVTPVETFPVRVDRSVAHIRIDHFSGYCMASG